MRGQDSHGSPTILNVKPPDGYTWSEERLTRRQATSRPDHLWPEMWQNMSNASQRKEMQKTAIEKPKLDNARKLKGIYFIDPKDEEFMETIKNERKRWKFRLKQLCLARSEGTSTGRPVAHLTFARQKWHALLKPTNLQESVWKELHLNIMNTILQGKEAIH